MSVAAYHHTMAGKSVTLAAPGKINLVLQVLGPRNDGYHEVRSLVMGVDLCDRLVCRPAPLTFPQADCSEPTLENQENLAVQAAMVLAEAVGRDPAVHFDIQKFIPVGGGMGGGSSDAAAALRLCNHLWQAGFDQARLATIGSRLGADVPLFFYLPAALLSGRGETVESIALTWSGWILLLFVDTPVSTRDVYAAWDPADVTPVDVSWVESIRRASTADQLTALLFNDLEPAVFRVCPDVARAHKQLIDSGFGPFRVTGAGSTLYRLFDEKDAACRVAGEIDKRQFPVRTSVNAAPFGPLPIVSEDN